MRCDGMGCDAMRNAMNPVEIPALRLDREFRQTEFRFLIIIYYIYFGKQTNLQRKFQAPVRVSCVLLPTKK
jgi:hypothetical protein